MTQHARYLGTKLVNLTPMTRGEYNEYRGWKQPEGEKADDPGYLVEYTDGGAPNDSRHGGYISWTPKAAADAAYRPIEALTFGLAIEAMKRGHRVARKGWNGKGMFLFLVPGSRFNVSRPPLLGIYPEGTEINYCPHIDMRTADGKIVPWLASQTDVLAEDWELLL
ncbi:hypothetical protein CEK28_08475 [Xenophilus sp. AP218F]|nr:hypothetical protein CEK28_08475 [Xenophilus sp. AP218F]